MTKKVLNQNSKYAQKLIDTIEPDFFFSKKPINRFKVIDNENHSKQGELLNLKKQINSLENCNLRKNSKNLILGDGDINSPIMIIGEAPSELEDNLGKVFQGEIGSLLKKMLLAIDIEIKKVYCTYSINFRPPNDRKPSAQEIKRSYINY